MKRVVERAIFRSVYLIEFVVAVNCVGGRWAEPETPRLVLGSVDKSHYWFMWFEEAFYGSRNHSKRRKAKGICHRRSVGRKLWSFKSDKLSINLSLDFRSVNDAENGRKNQTTASRSRESLEIVDSDRSTTNYSHRAPLNCAIIVVLVNYSDSMS